MLNKDMKTFSEYVAEKPSFSLEALTHALKEYGDSSHLKVDVTHMPAGLFKKPGASEPVHDHDSLHIEINLARHPGDATQEHSGVGVTVMDDGNELHIRYGYYANYSKSAEGTHYERTQKDTFSVNSAVAKVAIAILTKAAAMMTHQ
jgi:hypothetical protein